MSPEASRRIEPTSESLTWPPLEGTEAANDPTGEDLVDYVIPDAVIRQAPKPPTPVVAFPALSEMHIQPNNPSEEQLAIADRMLNGLALELLEDSGHQVKKAVPEDPLALTKIQAETAQAMLDETDYDMNLGRISPRTKPGARIPDHISAAVTPDNLAQAEIAPITKLVPSNRVPGTGMAVTRPSELKARVQKPTFFQRLFG